MNKILVTGGTGFIGNALVRSLLNNKKSVRVLDNGSRGNLNKFNDIKNEIEIIYGDIRNPRTVSKACLGVDQIIHLAFINGTKYFYTMPETVLDVGVRGIFNVIDAGIKNNIKELIVASSSEVYNIPDIIPTPENIQLTIPDPLNPRFSYSSAKIISEIAAINFGRKYFKKVLIFRPHNVYGPDMGQEHVIPELILRINKLSESGNATVSLQIQGNGLETRAFIYIDDFIKGLLQVIEKGGHLNIYNIGSDNEISIKSLATKIGNLFNKQIKIIPGRLQKGSALRRCPDITKLRKLGFKPEITLDKGLFKTYKWYIEKIQNFK